MYYFVREKSTEIMIKELMQKIKVNMDTPLEKIQQNYNKFIDDKKTNINIKNRIKKIIEDLCKKYGTK
jgi:tRNA uridine 5-carbamoylmethylation protein Kti12